MKDLSVVILNWNGKDFLKQFLPSVIKYSQEADIYIADNNSTDDSLKFLQENFAEDVKIIRFKENGGYSRGYNLALKEIHSKYYILLNSDVEVTPHWITPMLELMDLNPSIAACQPKIKDFNHKEYFEYAGAAGGFIDIYGYPFCRGRIFDTIEKDDGQYNDQVEIFWATGACLFVRSHAFWEVEGLDEDFFAHMEEIDLCWRLKNKGYSIYYSGKSEVYHVGGGTLNKLNPKKTYLNFRNNLYLLFKNLPRHLLLRIIFIRMVLDGIAAIKYLFSNSISHFIAIIKSHFHFYLTINKFLKKRPQHIPQILPIEVLRKSLVIQYFGKGIRKFGELYKK